MSGFLCFPAAEPTGKELEKNVSIVPTQGPPVSRVRRGDEQGGAPGHLLWDTGSALGAVRWGHALRWVRVGRVAMREPPELSAA